MTKTATETIECCFETVRLIHCLHWIEVQLTKTVSDCIWRVPTFRCYEKYDTVPVRHLVCEQLRLMRKRVIECYSAIVPSDVKKLCVSTLRCSNSIDFLDVPVHRYNPSPQQFEPSDLASDGP